MKLIVISNPVNISNEHTLVCSLFELGLTHFHLRKPELNYHELKEYILQIPEPYRNKVIIHSHHELAVEFGLKGIHFTNGTPFEATSNYPENMQISASYHSIAELQYVNPVFEYVFISPVFDSISKVGYKTKLNTEALRSFLKLKRNWPQIMALGGINENTINESMNLGFDGIALLGSIWLSDKPIESFKQLMNSVSEFNKIENKIHA